MDHRCPACGVGLPKRKLSQAIVARMEIDCPHCNSRIRLNLHRIEMAVTLVHFGSVVALGLLAYLRQSQGLVLLALAVAVSGALIAPLLERTWLRTWPRYAKS